MADTSTIPPVTRKEFYSSLSLIWLYIMIVIGQLLNDDAKWTLYLLFSAALLLALTYTVFLFRLAAKPKEPDKSA